MRKKPFLCLFVFITGAFVSNDAIASELPSHKSGSSTHQNWHGFYVGANLGYGWSRESATYINDSSPPTGLVFPLGTVVGTDHNGILGGLQLGYNFQIVRWLFGLEGEFSWTDAKTSTFVVGTLNTPSSAIVNAHTHWYSATTVRFGVVQNDFLFFAKAGAAWADITYGGSATVGAVTNPRNNLSPTRAGWIVGAGVEWKFASRLSAKVEYNFFDFGTVQLTPNSALGLLSTFDIKTQDHVVKLGLNYYVGMP